MKTNPLNNQGCFFSLFPIYLPTQDAIARHYQHGMKMYLGDRESQLLNLHFFRTGILGLVDPKEME